MPPKKTIRVASSPDSDSKPTLANPGQWAAIAENERTHAARASKWGTFAANESEDANGTLSNGCPVACPLEIPCADDSLNRGDDVDDEDLSEHRLLRHSSYRTPVDATVVGSAIVAASNHFWKLICTHPLAEVLEMELPRACDISVPEPSICDICDIWKSTKDNNIRSLDTVCVVLKTIRERYQVRERRLGIATIALKSAEQTSCEEGLTRKKKEGTLKLHSRICSLWMDETPMPMRVKTVVGLAAMGLPAEEIAKAIGATPTSTSLVAQPTTDEIHPSSCTSELKRRG